MELVSFLFVLSDILYVNIHVYSTMNCLISPVTNDFLNFSVESIFLLDLKKKYFTNDFSNHEKNTQGTSNDQFSSSSLVNSNFLFHSMAMWSLNIKWDSDFNEWWNTKYSSWNGTYYYKKLASKFFNWEKAFYSYHVQVQRAKNFKVLSLSVNKIYTKINYHWAAFSSTIQLLKNN